MDTPAELRLTKTVNRGGCAAKLEAGSLATLLAGLPRQEHPDLLVGTDFLDDAAVWRISEERLLVQTVDFFTPILDDPRDFGAVAAANALSDIFAMGGRPFSALTVLAFPSATLPGSVLTELMAGATERINAAGALLVGGHSIDDDTLKLGFSVNGFVATGQMWSNRGARPGDRLLLTKAVGTGTLTGGLKNDEVTAADLAEAIESMKLLNLLDLPPDLREAVHAATDVTGFGLLGHSLHIARGSNVTIEIEAGSVPLLANARETLGRGIVTRAHGSNTTYVAAAVAGRESISELDWLALVDPQTSGGLLLSVAGERAQELLAAVRPRFPRAELIGTVSIAGERPIVVR
ncbi:MAG TPA: selenide, water dikinase SelD [Trueperaceae bacterium]